MVSLPKSKMRCHAPPPFHFTHAMNVCIFETPAGRLTNWLLPLRFKTLPRVTSFWIEAPPLSVPLKCPLESSASALNG